MHLCLEWIKRNVSRELIGVKSGSLWFSFKDVSTGSLLKFYSSAMFQSGQKIINRKGKEKIDNVSS
jgi:flagellar motor protein MotB